MVGQQAAAIVSLLGDVGVVDDWTGELIAERVVATGGCVIAREAIARDEATLRKQLVTWISDPRISVVFVASSDAQLARRAMAPLVTEPEREPLVARCGSTRVVTLPSEPALAIAELGRILPARFDHPPAAITTGSIAVIGDLPAADDSVIDLRGRGRRGLLALGLVAAAATGGLAAVAMRVVQSNAPQPTGGLREDRAAAEPAPVTQVATSPAAVTPPVTALHVNARTPAPAPKPLAKSHPRPAPAEKPRAPKLAAAAEPSVPDSMCDQVTCAAIDYERECCTPFRPQTPSLVPDKLDRAMVASTLADVKAHAHECAREASVSEGTVKIGVTVRSDGHVSNVVLQEAPESGLGACVVEAIRGMTYPITQNGGSFVYGFDL